MLYFEIMIQFKESLVKKGVSPCLSPFAPAGYKILPLAPIV